MSSKPINNQHNSRQAGVVSIMVTIILMIVISLLVLGFAQIARRNSRQALDEQLSSQAFYAAETGVNDATNLVRDALEGGQSVPTKDTCDAGTGQVAAFYSSLQPVLSAEDDIEYTCLMVDPTPTTLRYGDVGTTSVIIPVIPETGSMQSLQLTWQTKEDTSTPIDGCPTSAGGVFTPTSNWTCGYGVLRFDLVPVNGTFNSYDLQQRTMTTFVVPQSSGGSAAVPYANANGNANTRVGAQCNNTNCSISITSLTAGSYYMRVSSQYKNVSLQLSAIDSGNAVGLVGAQALIDSTGKAQDVLRRIQVHAPLSASGTSKNQMSDYAIWTNESLCKRFAIMEGYFQNFVTDVTSSSPMCQD